MDSRSQQRTDLRVLVLTLKYLAPQKTGYSPVKSTSLNCFDFFLRLFYNFSVGTLQYFQKKKNYILSIKKRASKVAHNRPQTVYTITAPLPKPAQN